MDRGEPGDVTPALNRCIIDSDPTSGQIQL